MQAARPQRLVRNPSTWKPEPEPPREPIMQDIAPDFARGPWHRLPLIVACVAATLGLVVAIAI